ncbi:hypothetical protein QR680_011170 [Steinernema hermaphroditum]|uniref:Uncharacterized protein n=1 Tax=Steinernema hermaphroditum TaxID=289476 RepID=A0AA39IRD6_9BILA|nr:hypothetical protein QR680_011170 [Steinernema hermaphroditum]
MKFSVMTVCLLLLCSKAVLPKPISPGIDLFDMYRQVLLSENPCRELRCPYPDRCTVMPDVDCLDCPPVGSCHHFG